MPTRTVFVAAATLLLACSLGGPERAGAEGEAHKLSIAGSTWKKGQTVSIGLTRSWDVELEDKDWNDLPGGDLYAADIVSCDVRFDGDPAAGAQGVGALGPVTVMSGNSGPQSGRDGMDTSCGGMLFEVRGDTWKQTGGNAEPSSAGRAWLDKVFVPEVLPDADLAWLALLEPSDPQQVGQRWDVDAAALADRLGRFWHCKFDRKSAKASVLLEDYNTKMKPQMATLEVKLEVRLVEMPACASKLGVRLPTDAVVAVGLRGHIAQSGDVRLTSLTGSLRYNGPAEFKGQDAVLKLSMGALWSVRPDGWVPEPSQIR